MLSTNFLIQKYGESAGRMFDEIKNLVDRLYSMTVEDRKKLKGLQPERAEVISGGALLMQKILEFLCVGQVVTSERDNLEGYLIKKGV